MGITASCGLLHSARPRQCGVRRGPNCRAVLAAHALAPWVLPAISPAVGLLSAQEHVPMGLLVHTHPTDLGGGLLNLRAGVITATPVSSSSFLWLLLGLVFQEHRPWDWTLGISKETHLSCGCPLICQLSASCVLFP